jgi:hypothetical protein
MLRSPPFLDQGIRMPSLSNPGTNGYLHTLHVDSPKKQLDKLLAGPAFVFAAGPDMH